MEFIIACPCKSGHTTSAYDEGFSATSVAVEACVECRRDGVRTYDLRKSAAYALAELVPALRHKDGLVAFGG